MKIHITDDVVFDHKETARAINEMINSLDEGKTLIVLVNEGQDSVLNIGKESPYSTTIIREALHKIRALHLEELR